MTGDRIPFIVSFGDKPMHLAPNAMDRWNGTSLDRSALGLQLREVSEGIDLVIQTAHKFYPKTGVCGGSLQ